MPASTRPATLRHAAALCGIAGFVDAVGYFQFGHVFTANMTGNTVLLGAAATRADPIAFTYLATLAAFILGVVCAVLSKRRFSGVHVPLSVNAGLLVAVTFLAPANVVMLLTLAFAMGIQGATITTFSGIRLPTVVVTSTLVNLVEGAFQRTATVFSSAPQLPSNDQLRHLATAWVTYGLGGAAAVLAERLAFPLLVPALLYVLLAADLARPAAPARTMQAK